jgi:hypothetical protein
MDTLNSILEELTGEVEYAVQLVLATWPDGCWCCSVVLEDKERAIEQGLLAAKLEETVLTPYDMYDGFSGDIYGFGCTPLEAAQDLKAKLLKL